MINYIDYKGQNKILQMQLFDTKAGRSVEQILFLESDLGRLWQKLPIEALAKSLEAKLSEQGKHVPRWGYFDIRGAIAAKVLSCYYNGMSDKKLIEQLNLNQTCRWFCYMNQPMSEQIKDKDLLWRWRVFLGAHIDIEGWNVVTLKSWQEELEHPHLRLTDATCYEVKIAYPTDVKLLWQSCEWVYGGIEKLVKAFKLRSLKRAYKHYEEQESRQLTYSKRRKKTHAQTRSRIGQLLYWLEKGLKLIAPLIKLYEDNMLDSLVNTGLFKGLDSQKKRQNGQKLSLDLDRYKTIKKVFSQQRAHHDDPKLPIKDRIVSLQQPHIRPIVRGKEGKRVEFGAKVNVIRVGSVSVIDRFSFDSFNETTCFESACTKYSAITGTCTHMGADAIFASNGNRRFATQSKITTNFPQKGRQIVDEDKRQAQKQARSVIAKLRATRMEGSFGNEKEHYDVHKIMSKTPQSQKCSLLCALLTANAMTLLKRDKDKKKLDDKIKKEVEREKRKKQRHLTRAA
jgi:transposase, IS5 family